MYVADVTDMAELEYLLGQAQDDLTHAVGERATEQAQWDVEDIEERMAQIKA